MNTSQKRSDSSHRHARFMSRNLSPPKWTPTSRLSVTDAISTADTLVLLTCTTKQYLRFEATTMSFRLILKPLINGEQKWQRQFSSLRKPRCRLLLTSWLSATRIMPCFAHLCPYLIPITPLTRVDGATFMANIWNSPCRLTSLSLSRPRALAKSRHMADVVQCK